MEIKTNILTFDDQKVMKSLKKDFNKYKGLIISGSLLIVVGFMVIGSALFYSISKSDFVIGLALVIMGVTTIRDSIRNKKIYQLLEKLLKEDPESQKQHRDTYTISTIW